MDLITKDVSELRLILRERRKNLQKEKDKEVEKEPEVERGRPKEKEKHEREKEREKDKPREKPAEDLADREMIIDQEEKAKPEENGVSGGENIFLLCFLFFIYSYYYFLMFGCSSSPHVLPVFTVFSLDKMNQEKVFLDIFMLPNPKINIGKGYKIPRPSGKSSCFTLLL